MAQALVWDKPPSITMNNITSGTMLTCLAWQFRLYDSLSIANGTQHFVTQNPTWFLCNWRFIGCSWYSFISQPPRLAASLCQYYLFSTWLTCNLNSLNSNDNRLLCMGSHCIRGQGETDSLFVLCQWSLGLELIRAAKAYTIPNQLQPGQLNLSQTY